MRKPAAQPSKTGEATPTPQTGDLLAVLEEGQREVRVLLEGPHELDDLLKQWLPHQAVVEEVLLPALADQPADEDEAVLVRRDLVAILLAALRREQVSASAPVRAVLGELLTALMDAQAAGETGLFARARSAALDQQQLTPAADAARRAVAGRLDAGDDRDLEPKRLTLAAAAQGDFRQTRENDVMQRQYERERDAEGRFVSERGHGSSSRSGRYDDDDHRSARRRDEESRGHGGWFGDREGHAEAARRGWEERDDRRFGSRYEDDDRRHQSRSRYADDDRRSGRRDDDDRRGHGGWFGDREGHAEAARRGWEERDDRRSGSRYEDDRGYRSQSSRYDDERRSSRHPDDDRDYRAYSSGRYDDERASSRRRDDDDDHDGRRRGWSGDPEGHSQAARRGWEHRRG